MMEPKMTAEEMKDKISNLSNEIMKAGFGHAFLATDLNIKDLQAGIETGEPYVLMTSFGSKEIIAYMIMEFLAQNEEVYNQVRAMIFTIESQKMIRKAVEDSDLEGLPEDLGLPPKEGGFPGGNGEGGNC